MSWNYMLKHRVDSWEINFSNMVLNYLVGNSKTAKLSVLYIFLSDHLVSVVSPEVLRVKWKVSTFTFLSPQFSLLSPGVPQLIVWCEYFQVFLYVFTPLM